MSKLLTVIIPILALLLSREVSAQATFGPEFNFTSRAVYREKADKSEFRDRLVQIIAEKCSGCVMKAGKRSSHPVRFVYPDGWYFDVFTDNRTVEVTAKASTTEEIRSQLSRMQIDIFDAAESAGLKPAGQVAGEHWAGSHIHVGVRSALGGEPHTALRRLRNFIVDFSNHSELATGVFSNDPSNARALARLPETAKKNFEQLIADVDAGRINNVDQFAERLMREVYANDLAAEKAQGQVLVESKDHAINISRIGNASVDRLAQTFEVRAMRGQNSAQEFLDLTTLLEARLQFLANLRDNVPVELEAKPNWRRKADMFNRYVVEAGLDFELYKRYLSPAQRLYLRTAERADKFRTWTQAKTQMLKPAISRGGSPRCEAFFLR